MHLLLACYLLSVASGSKYLQIFKNSIKSWIFIENIFKPFEKRLRKIIISLQLDLCEKTLLILNFISEIKIELLLPISKRTTWSFSDIYSNKWAIDIGNCLILGYGGT